MDRRRFLSWFPKMAGVFGVALVAPPRIDKLEIASPILPKVEALPPEDSLEADLQWQIDACNAAAICFGLKPASPMSHRVAIMENRDPFVELTFDRETGNFYHKVTQRD